MQFISPILADVLRPTPLTEYLKTCRREGRAAIDADTRGALSSAYKTLRAIAGSGPRLHQTDWNLLNFATDFLWAEDALNAVPAPRYPVYTNLPVLDRYLGVRSHLPLNDLWRRCRRALTVLLRDWLNYERRAIESFVRGDQPALGIGFSEQSVRARIAILDSLLGNLDTGDTPAIPDLGAGVVTSYPIDWYYYANDHDGLPSLCHATALPQSKWHDEFLFLRTIHLNEICFWAIINGVRVATSDFRLGNHGRVAASLNEAAFFADFLVRTFQAFKTMPYESFFDGFRLATGNSSAIQSEKYQHLELITRGLNKIKPGAMAEHPELLWLLNWSPPPDATLAGLVAAVGQSPTSSEMRAIEQNAFKLDGALQSWRNVHLGIARQYLPKDAQGTGNQGVPYLEASYQEPSVFPHGGSSPADKTPDEQDWFIFSPGTVPTPTQRTKIIGYRLIDIDPAEARSAIDIAAKDFADGVMGRQQKLEHIFKLYDAEFSRYGMAFPLRHQLKTAITNGLPKDPVRRMLLALELSTGLLIGVHNLGKLTQQIQFMGATGGQQFKGIDAKNKVLRDGEWIFADKKGVFASYFQGPDSRTKVVWPEVGKEQKLSLLFLVMGAPGLSENQLNDGLAIIESWVKVVCPSFERLEIEVRP